jgi:hypothetical protein
MNNDEIYWLILFLIEIFFLIKFLSILFQIVLEIP